MIVTVVPLTVQTDVVVLVKPTVSPDDAVALTVNVGSPYVFPVKPPKVIVCDALLTTCCNALEVLFAYTPVPTKSAVMGWVPTARSVSDPVAAVPPPTVTGVPILTPLSLN